MILEFEVDPAIPFILEQPFLIIWHSIINVAEGMMTIRAHDKVEVFDI